VFDRPPREPEWLSWLFVVVWSAAIYATIPFTRLLTSYVGDTWGREAFTYGVIAVIVLAALAALVGLLRRPQTSTGGLLWLLAIAAVLVWLTLWLGAGSPEEALHFVQYGPLGLLLFRAFVHRIRDVSIYAAAAITGGIVGTVDEVIQWLTPGRYFGLHDVGLNFLAVALVQVAIAAGVRPAIISGWPDGAGLRRLCYLAALAVAVLGLCLQNTPDRFAWYTARLPLLGPVLDGANVMVEYGYLYEDTEFGVFRSRLTMDALRQADRTRAVAAAALLDRYRGREAYRDFLKAYPGWRDAFVYEARVHLYRRDAYVRYAAEATDAARRDRRLAVAYRENRIVEKYFANLLAASSYVWPADLRADAGRAAATVDAPYDSAVSRALLTRVSRQQALWVSVGLCLGLVLLGFALGRRVRP